MTNPHEPTPEFARFLEWQVTTAVRRQTRFAEPPRPAHMKYLGIAALVVVSILIGAGGVTAAGRIQANEQTKTLLAQQAGAVMVAQMEVDAAKQAAELAKKRAAVGMSTQEEAVAADRSLQRALLHLKRATLGTEEIGGSGKPVQDELSAPLVGTRDFVTERLLLDQQDSAMALASAAAQLKKAQTRFDVGLGSDVEVAGAQAELKVADIETQRVASLIDLRRQFLMGRIKAADLQTQQMLGAAMAQLAVAESDLVLTTKRYQQIQRLLEVGTMAEVDVLKVKVEMLTKQREIEQLKARIRMLQGR